MICGQRSRIESDTVPGLAVDALRRLVVRCIRTLSVSLATIMTQALQHVLFFSSDSIFLSLSTIGMTRPKENGTMANIIAAAKTSTARRFRPSRLASMDVAGMAI